MCGGVAIVQWDRMKQINKTWNDQRELGVLTEMRRGFRE